MLPLCCQRCHRSTLLTTSPSRCQRTNPRLRPTSSGKRGGGAYLCYDCLKRAKRPAKVQPLPGVLDLRTFERTKIELGRCDVCAEKKAIYHSWEAHANICEGCYARLVRE